jgi:hypothetical protein
VIFVDSQHPPGTIGIVRGELARYTDFEDSLDLLQVPRGTRAVRLKGPSVARNRNAVVEQMHGEWVAFFDDDHVVPRDTVMKLLSHNQPIVGALYSAKRPPFYPRAFKHAKQMACMSRTVGKGSPHNRASSHASLRARAAC